ncbi:DUF732 domain-containing protein [Corynebacterium sp. USCH3]|uniref:DUF732 domain-containing protein n=1 Tax=Corynebacterium sp. USCH3 TaxID=3024840 RepID=UPI0030B57ED4
MSIRSSVTKAGSVAATLLLAGALAACGGDSTVDSDDDAQSSGVPSVSSSTTGSATASSPTSSPAPDAGDGGETPRDGEVNEVEEPGGEVAPRMPEDDAFLSELKDNDIDLGDSEIQDQVIAAAHEQCLANEEGRDGFAVPMIAGQLQVQELTEVSAEDAERIITEAAESHYCS